MSNLDLIINVFLPIFLILLLLIGIPLFFSLRKSFLKYNPYKHEKLKEIGKPIEAKIIIIDKENFYNPMGRIGIMGGFGISSVLKYIVLEYNNDKKKYFYKIYIEYFKRNLSVSEYFLKKSLKKFKVGDNLRCYVNPKNYNDFYIDPQDVFIN